MGMVSQLLWLLGYGTLRCAVVRSSNSSGRKKKRDHERRLLGGTRIARLGYFQETGNSLIRKDLQPLTEDIKISIRHYSGLRYGQLVPVVAALTCQFE